MTGKNVTLVLSGGGARGFAHIGAIEEIQRRGYSINSVAGTSMGALVGGVYAMGKLNEFKEWLGTLDKGKMFRLLDFAFSTQGLIKGDRLLNTLKRFISDIKIEDLEIAYTATAFDLANNQEVVFSTGNLYDAIRASISIPTFFTPVIAGKSLLVDGGVVNNIPINNAVRTENDLLVAVNVNAETKIHWPDRLVQEGHKRPGLFSSRLLEFNSALLLDEPENKLKKLNYFTLIDNTIASATNQLARLIIERYPPEILIEISRRSAGTFDFFKAEELIEVGRLAAKKKLDSFSEKANPELLHAVTTGD